MAKYNSRHLCPLKGQRCCSHGRKSPGRQGRLAPEFGVGDANANCASPDFVVFQNFKHQIACITSTVQKM